MPGISPRGMPVARSSLTVGVAQVRQIVAGIGVLQSTNPAIQDGGQAGDKHVGGNIRVKNVVDLFQYLSWRWRAQTVGGVQHRAGDRHHDGSRNTLAANVPNDKPQTTVFEFEEVVEVSTDLAGRLVVGRHVVAWNPGQRFRQESLLDQASNLQLLFDALPLLSLLLLLGHGSLELLGTLCNPLFEVRVELPDLFFHPLALGDVAHDGEHEALVSVDPTPRVNRTAR